jgi:hypothetical protein
MKHPTKPVQPPRLATRLIQLFTLSEEESIVGDLFEEFSALATTVGKRSARRWYWRQTVRSIGHLFVAGFLTAPWSTVATVIAGFFFARYANAVPGTFLKFLTDRYLMLWSAHFEAYLWLLNGMAISQVLTSFLVGCILGLASKGREMVVTLTLSFVLFAMGIAFCIRWLLLTGDTGMLLAQIAGSLGIVAGGLTVRRSRRSTGARMTTR